MRSQEYYYYCVSNSCINYFRRITAFKKETKQNPQAVFVSMIDIRTGFMWGALFGKVQYKLAEELLSPMMHFYVFFLIRK